jgi:hypothetical protein
MPANQYNITGVALGHENVGHPWSKSFAYTKLNIKPLSPQSPKQIEMIFSQINPVFVVFFSLPVH